LEQKLNKTREYESKRKFQVSWATKLPWSKLQMGVDGCVHLVKYKVCLEVEHKNKLLAPKWDSLHKHTGQRKAKRNMNGVKKGEWYTNNDYKHNKNVDIYACKGREFVLQQITTRLVSEKRRKLVWFDTLFHTLKHG